MNGKFKSFGLITLGVVAGILVSLNFQAIGQLATHGPLPVAELRSFTEVYAMIGRSVSAATASKCATSPRCGGLL